MISKYKFFINKDKGEVIAVCRYAGRSIRGIAKCGPDDTFDEAIGKQLAYLRAEQKVKSKKLKNARQKFDKATTDKLIVERQYEKMKKYYEDSFHQAIDVDCKLKQYFQELSK